MIESAIVTRLLSDAALLQYSGGRIFVSSAPEGTITPYIVVQSADTIDNSDAIASFDIDIDIYDYQEDQRPLRAATRRVKAVLHEETVPDPEGFYGSIRPSFESRTFIKEKDATLSRANMNFSSIAIELIP